LDVVLGTLVCGIGAQSFKKCRVHTSLLAIQNACYLFPTYSTFPS